MRDDVIKLRAAVGEAIYFISPRDIHNLVAVGLGEIKRNKEHLFSFATGFNDRIAHAVDGFAATDELPAALCADAIGGDHVNVIFVGPRVEHVLGGAPCPGRPVGRQHDQLGAEQLERARRFGEARIVTDVDADFTKRQIKEARFGVKASKFD